MEASVAHPCFEICPCTTHGVFVLANGFKSEQIRSKAAGREFIEQLQRQMISAEEASHLLDLLEQSGLAETDEEAEVLTQSMALSYLSPSALSYFFARAPQITTERKTAIITNIGTISIERRIRTATSLLSGRYDPRVTKDMMQLMFLLDPDLHDDVLDQLELEDAEVVVIQVNCITGLY